MGVDYLHRMEIASRDIKLENTLLDTSPRPLVKICDFGYSKVKRFPAGLKDLQGGGNAQSYVVAVYCTESHLAAIPVHSFHECCRVTAKRTYC